jgi:transcriptional regulator with XRE-family HTH domain
MQRTKSTITCQDLLAIAERNGLSDSDICNKAKLVKVKLARSTLWRIRNGKLKGKPHLVTLAKLAKVLGHGE